MVLSKSRLAVYFDMNGHLSVDAPEFFSLSCVALETVVGLSFSGRGTANSQRYVVCSHVIWERPN